MRDHMFAEHADGQRTVEGRSSAFARNVTKREAETALAIREKIVEVAAQFARRNIPGSEVETGDFARTVREQTSLNFATHLQILLQTELPLARSLADAPALARNRDTRAAA